MKSKNSYYTPIDKQNIQYIIYDAPAHKKFNINGVIYCLKYAIDFLCKETTPIHASLNGKVVAIQNSVTKTWNKNSEPPKNIMTTEEQDGNYVVLEHTNGELSIYAHLQKDSINVKEGDILKQGDKIALSGNTGWSIAPHLHFMVHDFPKKHNGGFRSIKPNWHTNSQEIINKRTITHKKYLSKINS